MKRLLAFATLAVVGLPGLAPGQDKLAQKNKTYNVPYRLTIPKHILVRAKINNKGPYNFILDTGAPMLIVAEDLCKELGIKPDRDGWGDLDRFEIEGGVVVPNARAYVHTPFQLEGMNGMGLAGAKLHGMIGFDILARYRMEFDFTRDKMVWTELDWEPKGIMRLGKGRSGAGGMEVIGKVMQMLGGVLGRQAQPEPVIRGFLGVELEDAGLEDIRVKSILEGGPAAKSQLKAGDRVVKFQGRTVLNVEDVHRFASRVRPGDEVEFTVLRGDEQKKITLRSGEGL